MRASILLSLLIIPALLTNCGGCSKSARIVRYENRQAEQTDPPPTVSREERVQPNIVKMKQVGGVYMVPVEINGVPMDFIFDTGASDITLSVTEALFLYRQNRLSDTDFKGTRHYQIADGSITEGTVVILKSVKIGNKTLSNVEASIVHNLEAPLLMGQSALSQFGTISIDYNRMEIRFE